MNLTRRELLSTSLLVFVLAASAGAQTTQPASQPDEPRAPQRGVESMRAAMFIRGTEAAHGKSFWEMKEAVQADITVEFGGAVMMSGTMTYDHRGGRVRIKTTEGVTLVFDGSNAWVSPASSELSGARFHLLTWPYFLAAPFKLRDPGVGLTEGGRKELFNAGYETFKLTFDAGIGDSPDDWYVVYSDPMTRRIFAMAYIVTYGTSADEAEKEPHIIVYDDYQTVDGVVLSTAWRFYNWNEETGATGDPIGQVSLSNIQFVEPDANAFTRPEDAREDAVPAG